MHIALRHLVARVLVFVAIVFTGEAQGAAVPVPQDIVSWWAGDDSALDLAGGLDGLPLGSPGFAAGVVGRALAFDGVNDRYVTFEDDAHDITGDLSIEGWIRIAGSSSGNRAIIQKASSDGQNVCYALSVNGAGKLAFSSTTAGAKTEVNTVAVLPVDTDVHVAITLLSGDLRMYIDGAESAHIFFGTDRPATDAGAILGATMAGGVTSNYFAGNIDELSLYKRALTASEIAGIHAAGSSGKARYDAARQFEAWSAEDSTQTGIWRYGRVGRADAASAPLVSGFQEFTNGLASDPALRAWIEPGNSFAITGNVSGEFQTRVGSGGPNIYFPPSALVLHPPDLLDLTAIKWTAPAAGDYAVSVWFAGADGQPTSSEAVVVAKTAFGDFRILPYTAVNGCVYENEGVAIPFFRKLALEADETVFIMVGRGSNGSASYDSTAVFANIVPLSVLNAGTAPTVTTAAATGVTATAATLKGSVNPQSAPTSYHFEYGTSTAYGQTTAEHPLAAGTTPVNVSADLTGLIPSTTYHFRLVATSASGTTAGSDLTFTTAAALPPADFSVAIVDLKPGMIVSPAAKLYAGAAVQLDRGSRTKITGVQFLVDGQPVGPVDTKSKYKFDGTIGATGPHTLVARATDATGRFVLRRLPAGVLTLAAHCPDGPIGKTIDVPVDPGILRGQKLGIPVASANPAR